MAIEIKAVLFDYGNVLCFQHLEADLQAMAICLALELSPLTEAYWHFRDQFDLGHLNGADYWSAIAKHSGVSITESQIARLIQLDNVGWSRPNDQMVNWAKRVKASGIATAIVSNMPVDIRSYLRTVNWLPEFDHYSFSCELKSLKPDFEIYRHTLDSLKVEPANALFIDDREVNCQAARKLGMHSIVFTDSQSLHELVTEFKLPPIHV
jgi:putative hydrolase of the HAD superfamily